MKSTQIVALISVSVALLLLRCEAATDLLPALPGRNAPAKIPLPNAQSSATAKMEEAVRQGINKVRQENNLQPLKNNERLAQVARNYSQQMARDNFFSHTGSDGSTLSQRVRAGGIFYWAVGENLFRSRNAAQPVEFAIKGWMNSPGHRQNILHPIFSETGIGVWREGNSYYITQLFLR
ncbi:CAP domain-containing protein [Floridanema aerugineum]|uniref:CAP domain-containing protein n=1 Tax=Floridaenema aerugineum BLCC-F46 TaxID=3153654 RepID=A0ABV4X1Z4_9CYAN